jgi:hypothetical protein
MSIAALIADTDTTLKPPLLKAYVFGSMSITLSNNSLNDVLARKHGASVWVGAKRCPATDAHHASAYVCVRVIHLHSAQIYLHARIITEMERRLYESV